MSEDAIKLATTRSDREIAADFRSRIEVLLHQAVDIMNEANGHGLQVGWQIGRDQFGRNRVMEISIMRPL